MTPSSRMVIFWPSSLRCCWLASSSSTSATTAARSLFCSQHKTLIRLKCVEESASHPYWVSAWWATRDVQVGKMKALTICE